ncbi:MAG: hypothetical protein GXW85_10500 [Clostridia bacterium]|nr:hypothetical protein [Clostridia bacterium]
MFKNKGIFALLLLALAVGTLLSPFAASSPDGLEKVAEDKGFIELAKTLFYAPIPDYLMPGIQNQTLATALAGFAGVLLTLIIVLGLGKLISKKD